MNNYRLYSAQPHISTLKSNGFFKTRVKPLKSNVRLKCEISVVALDTYVSQLVDLKKIFGSQFRLRLLRS